jgi:hypothetical protein
MARIWQEKRGLPELQRHPEDTKIPDLFTFALLSAGLGALALLWRLALESDRGNHEPVPGQQDWPLSQSREAAVALLVFTPTLTGKKFRKQQGVLLDSLAWLQRNEVAFFYVPAIEQRYLPNHTPDFSTCHRLRDWFDVTEGQFLVVIASSNGEVYLTSDRPLARRELEALLQAARDTYQPREEG